MDVHAALRGPDSAPVLGPCPGDALICVCVCVPPQLKEMCRRELDKSESEIKKNGSIIGEYKQVRAAVPAAAARGQPGVSLLSVYI